jgi:hypothetical protein
MKFRIALQGGSGLSGCARLGGVFLLCEPESGCVPAITPKSSSTSGAPYALARLVAGGGQMIRLMTAGFGRSPIYPFFVPRVRPRSYKPSCKSISFFGPKGYYAEEM